MPSDSRNSTMAKATGLIFSLFNVTSAQEVPFAIPLYMHAMHSSWTYHGPPLCPIHLCSSQKVSIARDGFHLLRKSSVLATLITIFFKQLLICTAEHSW